MKALALFFVACAAITATGFFLLSLGSSFRWLTLAAGFSLAIGWLSLAVEAWRDE